MKSALMAAEIQVSIPQFSGIFFPNVTFLKHEYIVYELLID